MLANLSGNACSGFSIGIVSLAARIASQVPVLDDAGQMSGADAEDDDAQNSVSESTSEMGGPDSE